MDRRHVGRARILRGNTLALPLADDSVDLMVTSPPYFGLRSYQDGGKHYAGQIGAEATPAEFVDALIAATREMVRVLKPSGSIWVNLGDKYAGPNNYRNGLGGGEVQDRPTLNGYRPVHAGVANKSLIGIPWRYALRCIDDLGLILRAEVIWSKPNGLPESVTDRVRRSHEQWFHFSLNPRYYSAVDEIREAHVTSDAVTRIRTSDYAGPMSGAMNGAGNPLGKLPGSVWSIPTQPLKVPAELGIDHFAAFPMEFPRRIIQGWSPAGVCVECGEGRRPVIAKGAAFPRDEIGAHRNGKTTAERGDGATVNNTNGQERNAWRAANPHVITGESCACPEPTADTTPGVVLDPFGGTGTTALVAKALGRDGISVDMSADYCRLAKWRTNDPGELANAMCVDKPLKQIDGQVSMFDLLDFEGGAA